VDLTVPKSLVEIRGLNSDDIPNKLHADGLLSDFDMKVLDDFIADLESSNFDTALNNYETRILSLKLNDNEFEKMNVYANLLKTMNHNNPEVFINSGSELDRWPDWGCIKASAALGLATAALSACAGGGPIQPACYAAIAAYVLALDAYYNECT